MNDAPFHDYQTHLRFLRGNMNRGHDNFIVAHGPEGAGKSTDLITIAKDLNPAFDYRRDVIRSMEDLLNVLIREATETPEQGKHRVRLVDEGADLFLNRDWNTVENKEGTKIGRKARVLRGTWLVAIPDFEGLDPWIRHHRCWTRIYQPADFDGDGYVHAYGKVMWRQEWFDYTEQRVVHRWQDVYDLDVPSLDKDPSWQGYEMDKRLDVKQSAERLLRRMHDPKLMRRRGLEQDPKPDPKPNGKKPKAPKKPEQSTTGPSLPPITT